MASLSEVVREWLLSPLQLQVAAAQSSLERKLNMNHAELAAELAAVGAQLEKAKAEVMTKVAELEAAIVAAGQTTPEVDAALAALKGSAQALDDLNPDAPAPAPEPDPAP